MKKEKMVKSVLNRCSILLYIQDELIYFSQ